MAQTIHALSALFFLLLLAILLPHPTTGFRFELIHRDSRRSPLYNANLTSLERFRRLLDLSKVRTSSLLQPSDEATNTVRAPVSLDSGLYLVLLSIGTPARPYFLQLDTGSDLSWIQCSPCDPCFNQSDPIFDPARSTSFVRLPCADPFCAPPYTCSSSSGSGAGDTCSFSVPLPYGVGSTSGSLARESFTTLSNAGTLESVPGLVFGCAHSTSGPFSSALDGVLGLGPGAESFASQLNGASKGRFSYCLVNSDYQPTYTYLRFGDDARLEGGAVQTVPLLTAKSRSHYYLPLVDISVGDRRLNLSAGTFDIQQDGSGGCAIDTGTPVSSLIRPAYDSVKAAVVEIFAENERQRTSGSAFGLDLELCYVKGDFVDYPTMTLHFLGADMKLVQDVVFYTRSGADGIICLAMMPSDEGTMLGAMQQQDRKFEFDVAGSQLRFTNKACIID